MENQYGKNTYLASSGVDLLSLASSRAYLLSSKTSSVARVAREASISNIDRSFALFEWVSSLEQEFTSMC
jgi:hypothetical protein